MQRSTSSDRKPLTQVFQKIFAVIGCHVVNGAIALIPPLDVLFAVTAQHFQRLLHKHTEIPIIKQFNSRASFPFKRTRIALHKVCNCTHRNDWGTSL